jgi:hypothetical protein
LGVTPTFLNKEDLLVGDLSRFKTIVLGVRAYKARPELKEAHSRLTQWMEDGGHLILLYNKTSDINSGVAGRGGSPYAPFTARVSDHRITSEHASVEMLLPSHPFLLQPNAITQEDFDGWVQERATYMLESKSEAFEELLRLQEPPNIAANSTPLEGGLVSAKVGKGRWTYVGLTLFRQIPEAVPGSIRLMMNMLSWRADE